MIAWGRLILKNPRWRSHKPPYAKFGFDSAWASSNVFQQS
jgi:hypothetical protein